MPVGPISREHAEQLLRALAEGNDLKFTDKAIDQFLELIGPPVPYFIHLFVQQMVLEPGLKGRPLQAEDVNEVYEKRVLGRSCQGYFQHYRDRLERYGEPGKGVAAALLTALSEAPDGRAADSSLYEVYRRTRRKGASEFEYREILSNLEYDWYVSLDTTTNEYYFLLDVMRDWWHRFFRKVPRRTRRAPKQDNA